MQIPAIEEYCQTGARRADFSARIVPCGAITILAAGVVVFCQYADIAAAQSSGARLETPLPVQAPVTENPKQITSPAPDVWSESEIADARRICSNALKSMSAQIEELQPIKKGPCGSPAPVRLISIGKTNPVKFKPAPTISCRMLMPLKQWIDRGLQPAAARHLDTRVTTISVMSSYSCRTRYGRKGARMSEHAFANALDIGGFRVARGDRVSVLKDWGRTKRDIAKAAALARAEKLKAEQSNTAKAGPTAAPVTPEVPTTDRRRNSSAANASGDKAALPEVRIDKRRVTRGAEERRRQRRERERRSPRQAEQLRTALAARTPTRLDQPIRRLSPRSQQRQYSGPVGGAFGAPAPVVSPPPLPVRRPLRRAVRSDVTNLPSVRSPLKRAPQPSPSGPRQFKAPYRLGGPRPAKSQPRSAFLRAIHQSACRIFGTTLGPEANEAHRNHFHFDMFPRKRRGYCE